MQCERRGKNHGGISQLKGHKNGPSQSQNFRRTTRIVQRVGQKWVAGVGSPVATANED
jgi:hypothetical protein